MELCRKMPIETAFTFAQRIGPAARAAAPADLLGLLRGLVGTDPPPPKNPHRKWIGKGFNMIWRPNHGGQSGPEDSISLTELWNLRISRPLAQPASLIEDFCKMTFPLVALPICKLSK